jgi:hypothetical protein
MEGAYMINIKAAVLTFNSFINNSVDSFKKEYNKQVDLLKSDVPTKSVVTNTTTTTTTTKPVIHISDASPVLWDIYSHRIKKLVKGHECLIRDYTFNECPYNIKDIVTEFGVVLNKYKDNIENSLANDFYWHDDYPEYIKSLCELFGVNVEIKSHSFNYELDIDVVDYLTTIVKVLINYSMFNCYNDTLDEGGECFLETLNNYHWAHKPDEDLYYRQFEQIVYIIGCIYADNGFI